MDLAKYSFSVEHLLEIKLIKLTLRSKNQRNVFFLFMALPHFVK